MKKPNNDIKSNRMYVLHVKIDDTSYNILKIENKPGLKNMYLTTQDFLLTLNG